MSQNIPFGQIAVRQNFITQDQLNRALSEQSKHNMRIGDLLVHLGFMSQAHASAIAKFQDVLSRKDHDDELIGRILNNCLILDIAGRGSGGITYKAHHLNLDRDVAIKVLSREALSDLRVVDNFRLEAKAIARLSHPSIVAVYDFCDEPGFPYLVLEYVEGKSLRDMIEEQGALAPRAVVWTALKLTAALGAAHARGIVHRDIKPENVLISRRREVKLADFGTVKFDDPELEDPERKGEITGTPHYMSPEQVRASADIDYRADYYSLGIVLYEMLTGQPPFNHGDVLKIFRDHMHKPLPDLTLVRPNTPVELVQLITELTAKNREQRLTDPSLITARLHDMVSQWTSLPSMFPNVTQRQPHVNLASQQTVSAEAERMVAAALAGSLKTVVNDAIMARKPSCVEFCHRLAEALFNEGRFEDLIDLHPEMIIVASDISRVHILLGQAYHKLKRFDEALLALRCAWVLDRDDLQVGLSIARIFHAKDQKTSAVKLLTDFLDQHSHNITVLQRIAEFFYLELSEPDLAISAYWKASELAEKDRWAMLQKIGWIELERDKPAEARVALEKAIEVAPDPAFALKLLGRAYALDKDLARAEECFSRSLELDPFDVETRVELIELLELQQRFKRIVKIARAGLKQSPGDLQLSIARGKAHLELQDAETAARVFRRILRKHPQSRPAKEGLVAAQRLRKSK